MNRRFIGVLIFAFIVATGASVVIYRSLNAGAPPAKAAAPATRVVLAARDLEVGTILKEGDVRLADWPGSPPAGAATQAQDVVGRGVITAIYAKEPLLDSRLAPKGAGGGLAATIPSGMRAFAIRVNDVVGVAGFVTPGMRVDVLINGTSPGSDNSMGTLARTLLQNVEVLSAGQEIKRDNEGKAMVSQVVTLLVTPEQAEKMSLAANQTTVQLVLRNPLDRQVAQTTGSALGDLFNGGPKRQAVAADAPPRPRVAALRPVVREVAALPKKEPPFTMEIISGTKKSESKFENSGEGK
jgi:pilus assembly protein CpaB